MCLHARRALDRAMVDTVLMFVTLDTSHLADGGLPSGRPFEDLAGSSGGVHLSDPQVEVANGIYVYCTVLCSKTGATRC